MDSLNKSDIGLAIVDEQLMRKRDGNLSGPADLYGSKVFNKLYTSVLFTMIEEICVFMSNKEYKNNVTQ
jgi:hypothetical protein